MTFLRAMFRMTLSIILITMATNSEDTFVPVLFFVTGGMLAFLTVWKLIDERDDLKLKLQYAESTNDDLRDELTAYESLKEWAAADPGLPKAPFGDFIWATKNPEAKFNDPR